MHGCSKSHYVTMCFPTRTSDGVYIDLFLKSNFLLQPQLDEKFPSEMQFSTYKCNSLYLLNCKLYIGYSVSILYSSRNPPIFQFCIHHWKPRTSSRAASAAQWFPHYLTTTGHGILSIPPNNHPFHKGIHYLIYWYIYIIPVMSARTSRAEVWGEEERICL